MFPDYINNIENENERHNKKQNFKRACEGYDFNFQLNRLTKTIKLSKTKDNIKEKTYFIPYEFEKINIIKNLHEISLHKGINVLYELIKESDFWWHNIYDDVYKYINKI